MSTGPDQQDNALAFTGERFTPECQREIWYEHMHRYALARRLVAGRDVLDAACGEGYGTALLATAARRAVGVDNSAEAVEHARRRYGGDFRQGDVTALADADDSFDAVVSFETIEHLAAQREMLAEFRRVLRPDGFLLISSPDRKAYSDDSGYSNPHHVRELYRDEFEALLAEHFPAVRLLGQKLVFHSQIWALEDGHGAAHQQYQGDAVADSDTPTHAPMYYLALCAGDPKYLPDTAGVYLFDDAEESVYAHYNQVVREVIETGHALIERDRRIRELQQRLRDAGAATPRGWLRRLLRR